jgi:hypothetical protein
MKLHMNNIKTKLLIFIIAIALLLFGSTDLSAYSDWTQVNTDGFGDPGPTFGSEDFFSFYTYSDCLLAGIEATSYTEGARLYRSCDGTTWNQINPDGFAITPISPPAYEGAAQNDHIDDVIEFKGYLYASTAVQNNTFLGTKLYRTNNIGATWEPIIIDGFGSQNNENFKALNIFQDQLCGGTWNSGGVEVWCSEDGINFTKANISGFDNSDNTIIWESAIYNESIYFTTTNSVTGGEVWKSNDLINWIRVINQSAGSSPVDTTLSSLIVFEDQLLIMNDAYLDRIEVIRINPDDTHEVISTIVTNDAGLSSYSSTVLNGYLHISTRDVSNGASIWRSHDLENWELISTPGFGDTANRYSILHSFGNYVYAGTGNYITGQEVWRYGYNLNTAVSVNSTTPRVQTNKDNNLATFDIQINNIGEDPVGNLNLEITYTQELSSPLLTQTPDGWICTPNQSEMSILCNTKGILPINSSLNFTISFEPTVNIGNAMISASVGNDALDSDDSDNIQSAESELYIEELAASGNSNPIIGFFTAQLLLVTSLFILTNTSEKSLKLGSKF